MGSFHVKCGILGSPIYFICEASYVKELHRECHKIVISYVDIVVEYIYIQNIQKIKTFNQIRCHLSLNNPKRISEIVSPRFKGVSPRFRKTSLVSSTISQNPMSEIFQNS